MYSELKQYRADSNLVDLLKASVPGWLLDLNGSIEGKRLARTYVLDGVDEVPMEALAAFGKHLDELLTNDKDARAFLTARQAFYVANRGSLPQFPSVFHILEFSDDDIREYIGKFGTEYDAFMNAVRQVDAADEIRNPFVLGVMLERFSQAGGLSKVRSDNLSFIIDSLIQSRPLIGQHKQRRALCMLAVAMETYCRNELTESEALQIITQAMPITDTQAPQLLQELYGSILRRTANGFAFQMRSYGEYLAAEALENDTAADLQRQVEERMGAIAAEDLAPWCKLGNIVFRSSQVEDHGEKIEVTARIKDDAVARALEATRGDQLSRGTKARFTWSGRSRHVKIVTVKVTTTSARSKLFRLTLETVEAPQEAFLEMSVGGRTPADLTEIALKGVLFGEPNPMADHHMDFAAEIDDPLSPLREERVSEEIVRPLSELLVTDILVGSGRAIGIHEFRLGVPIRGRRKLTLSWEPAKRYSNEKTTIRTIQGEVDL